MVRSVPENWLEGSLALGVNRWRTFWKIGVRTARPALIFLRPQNIFGLMIVVDFAIADCSESIC